MGDPKQDDWTPDRDFEDEAKLKSMCTNECERDNYLGLVKMHVNNAKKMASELAKNPKDLMSADGKTPQKDDKGANKKTDAKWAKEEEKKADYMFEYAKVSFQNACKKDKDGNT